jgi:DNA-binding XRE family transcriptional regulator
VGWSREALAFHAGVSWSAIAQIESGRRNDVRLSSLVALASALGVSVDYLIGTAGTAPRLFEHRLLQYASDDGFAAGAVPFLVERVEQSHCVLAVASTAKIGLLRDHLGDRAGLVEFADWADWYGTPTAALRRYRDFVAQRCGRGAQWVSVVAEAGWSGQSDAALAVWNRYEAVVSLVFAPWPATIMCTYDERVFSTDVLAQAHRTHPEIAHAAAVTVNAAYRDPEALLLEPDRP